MEGRVKRRGSRTGGSFGDDRVYNPEQRVNVKENKARNGVRESINGGAVGGEPEIDTSDGFGEIEDCGLQRHLVM